MTNSTTSSTSNLVLNKYYKDTGIYIGFPGFFIFLCLLYMIIKYYQPKIESNVINNQQSLDINNQQSLDINNQQSINIVNIINLILSISLLILPVVFIIITFKFQKNIINNKNTDPDEQEKINKRAKIVFILNAILILVVILMFFLEYKYMILL